MTLSKSHYKGDLFLAMKMFYLRMGWDWVDGWDGMGWDGVPNLSFNFFDFPSMPSVYKTISRGKRSP